MPGLIGSFTTTPTTTTTGQTGTLTTNQASALTTGQIGALTTGQTAALVTGQPSALTTGQAAALTTNQVAAIGTTLDPTLPDTIAHQTGVDPTKTTAGLLNSLIDENSPYIQRARALSMEKMNERGLASSSLAQGAGTAAAIDAALGIAAPDAQIYSTTGLTNTAARNATVAQGQQMHSNEVIAARNVDAQKALQAGQLASNEAIQAGQRASNEAIANKNVEAQRALQLNQQQYQTLTNGSNNALTIMTTLQTRLSAIQMDTTATAAAKQAAARDAINIAKGAMQLISHSTGDVSFNTALDFILDQEQGNDSSGNSATDEERRRNGSIDNTVVEGQ